MEMNDQNYHTRSLYIDVELTCWAEPPPTGMKQEIIEIGLAEMDLNTLVIAREKACFVRPRMWDISDRCTQLTGISNDDIRSQTPRLSAGAKRRGSFQNSGFIQRWLLSRRSACPVAVCFLADGLGEGHDCPPALQHAWTIRRGRDS